MREEIKRINRLVAEGKLSEDDAADLIEAIYAGQSATPPPPPPPDAPKEPEAPKEPGAPAEDPFKGLMDSFDKLAREAAGAVDWKEFSRQAKETAKKGVDVLRQGLDDLGKGGINFNWLTNTETKKVEMPLVFTEGKTLRVENACGSVKIFGGAAEGKISAEAKVQGASLEDAKAKAEGYTFVVEESDHVVLVKQPDLSGLSVDLVIHLPFPTNIELRAEAGDVEIVNTGLGCRVQSRSGDIELRGLNGLVDIQEDSGEISIADSVTTSLTIENKSGNVSLKNVQGNINARTASGNIEAEGTEGKVLSLESVSGNVEVELRGKPIGSINVRTVSGNAEVSIPADSDVRISLSTLRGHVHSDIELEDAARTEQRLTGRIGAGTGLIDVSAVTGNVHLNELESDEE
jgi:hypothetical protein